MKRIIDIPEEDLDAIKFLKVKGWASRHELLILNGTPIPDNATNGEVIKTIFPYGKYSEYFADVEMKTEENDTRFKSVFDRDWWDAPYQKGDGNDI